MIKRISLWTVKWAVIITAMVVVYMILTVRPDPKEAPRESVLHEMLDTADR